MRFYTKQHQFYCGIDLHARTIYVCILNQDGEILLHRNMNTSPETLLRNIAPYRADIVVAVECLFTWDLARRPLLSGRDSLCPRACPLHEGHPRWQSETGQERRLQA